MSRIAVFVVSAAALVAPVIAQEAGPCASATALALLAGPEEPGERLIVRGQVYGSDGVTPAAGVTVYAYHTAADGEYHRERGGRPRLSGYVRTDQAGRFELQTIRPAPYPGGRIAAHVHFQLWGSGVALQYAGDLLFAGDPAISEAERNSDARAGRFGSIRSPERQADGTLVVDHLLRLKERGDRLEAGVTDHGVKPCS